MVVPADDFIRTIPDYDEIDSGSTAAADGAIGLEIDGAGSEDGYGSHQERNRNKRKRGINETVAAQNGGWAQSQIRKRMKGRHHPEDGNRLDDRKARNGSDERTHGKSKVTNGVNGSANGYYMNRDRTDDPDDEVEDDAEIMSDFEFAVDDMVNGNVSDDFDGWGIGVGAPGSAMDRGIGVGDKKGVDLDEIIARRRGRKGVGERDDADIEGGKSSDAVNENILWGDSEDNKEDVFERIDGNNNDIVNKQTNGTEEETFLGFEDDEADEYLADDAFGMNVSGSKENDEEDEKIDGDSNTSEEASGSHDDDEREYVAKPVPHPYDEEDLSDDDDDDDDDDDGEKDDDDESKEDPEEAKRKAAFFAAESDLNTAKKSKNETNMKSSFASMSLSRPIMKGLSAVGFTEPTPIQTKTIPIALLGKDVVGGAVTGSGKTAAFIIPILERLLYRPKKLPTTRVALLMPTRELAVQCFNVARKLASFTDITFAQIVGGFSLREQENVLKKRPDVIIATPGRFIDHMRNSPSFAVDALEILVLDEADRMLEDGFADELNEILTTIPKSRQTLLFSATMTDSIDKLVRVGLNRPVRLLVDARKQTVSGLVQEFVRLRQGKEDKRLAYLLYLCENVFTERVIIFFRQKREAHRVRVVFGLCGFKAGELHGSMTQEQRIQSVESFRSGQVSFLLATDLAARGLDIKNVNTVINYTAPQNYEIYLHRVGRTARAGRTGHACTLAAESDRKVVKTAVRHARAQDSQIRSRTIPADTADAWSSRLQELQDEIDAVLADEKAEKALASAERDVRRGENLVVYEKEISARPKRTWFESEKEKKMARGRGRRELNGLREASSSLVEKGTGEALSNGQMTRKKEKKGKLSGKEKKRLDLRDERETKRAWKKGAGERLAAGGGKGGKGYGKANGRAKGKNKMKTKVKRKRG